MYERRQLERCWNMLPYRSEEAARAAGRNLESGSARVHVYQCKSCRMWHMRPAPRRKAHEPAD